jgi:hypothetical protein
MGLLIGVMFTTPLHPKKDPVKDRLVIHCHKLTDKEELAASEEAKKAAKTAIRENKEAFSKCNYTRAVRQRAALMQSEMEL